MFLIINSIVVFHFNLSSFLIILQGKCCCLSSTIITFMILVRESSLFDNIREKKEDWVAMGMMKRRDMGKDPYETHVPIDDQTRRWMRSMKLAKALNNQNQKLASNSAWRSNVEKRPDEGYLPMEAQMDHWLRFVRNPQEQEPRIISPVWTPA